MPEILGTAYRRILYLDCDTLVLSPLDALMATPFHATAAAVKGPGSSWRTEVAALQIPDGSSYFNAGVMLIDTSRWHKAALTDRFVELGSSAVVRQHGDQGPLNLLLREDQQYAGFQNGTILGWSESSQSPSASDHAFHRIEAVECAWRVGRGAVLGLPGQDAVQVSERGAVQIRRPSPAREALHRLQSPCICEKANSERASIARTSACGTGEWPTGK